MPPIALTLVLLAAVPPALPETAWGLASVAGARLAALSRIVDPSPTSTAPTFDPAARAVSNWRLEAAQDLEPLPLSAAAALLGIEQPVVTRCVKLNNYWCIKRAGWNGEIGADDEGHVGFANAERGADAAVTLLRRYYLEFGRKSALDIVRRWAPAECRTIASLGTVAPLAVRGIGMTLRARWLASRRARPAASARVASSGPVVPAARSRPRVSVVPLRPLPAFRVPDIAAGMGERKAAPMASPTVRAGPARSSSPTPRRPRAAPPAPAVAAIAPALKPPAPRPSTVACAPDEQRIQNYAARIVRDLALQPSDDLKLFDLDGRPLANLSRVLLAMSSVELGRLRAGAALVESAIARATPPEANGPAEGAGSSPTP